MDGPTALQVRRQGTPLRAASCSSLPLDEPRLCCGVGISTVANASLDAGFRAVLHRHHFASTAERASLAREITGFPLLGAIICNVTAGGLSPSAVELALRMGAVWIGLPTLSAQHFRQSRGNTDPAALRGAEFGPAELRLCDEQGKLLEEVADILDLADEFNVPVNVGYASFQEIRAVVDHGRGSSKPFVLTNPLTTMGWSPEQLGEILASEVIIETTCYALWKAATRGDAAATELLLWQVTRPSRTQVVLSSDSGLVSAPKGPDLLRFGWKALVESGVSTQLLEQALCGLPADLIGVSNIVER
jgi:Family of unknown function (DUF6282)